MLISEGVPGDFVECGVFAGSQVAAMAKALVDTGATDKRIHLFDSFEGIPAGGPRDREWIHPAGTSAASIEQVRSNMNEWAVPAELLVYHPGMFAQTVPVSGISQIALLRLDGDLYESTKVCIENLYPLVVRDGWIIADDYGLSGCRDAVEPFLEECPVYWRKA